MRKGFFACLLFFFATLAYAQPVITRVDRTSASAGQPVIISGSGFGTSTAGVVVYFGAAKATPVTVTDELIEVTMPPGATFEHVTVTKDGLTASSPAPVLLSFGGEHPITFANFEVEPEIHAETGLFDICLCDLDGDDKVDVAAANSGDPNVGAPAPNPAASGSIFRNTSTPGTFSFAPKVSVLPGIKSRHIDCEDIDGDGKKDLVITESDPGNRIFVLRNTSTTGSISFTTETITLAGKNPKRVEIFDLNLDGKPEVILTDQNSANKNVIILPNQSTPGTIAFGTLISLPMPTPLTAINSDALAIQDLDDDGFADIITSQFLTANGNIYVFKNKSTPVAISFEAAIVIELNGSPVDIRVGDIDGDAKADIAVTRFTLSSVSVLRNMSTPTALAFAAPVDIATGGTPFGLDLGDLDGDSKADIVVASLRTPTTNPKKLTILNNKSTVGNISFETAVEATTDHVNRHVLIGDIDTDGKPDISYTSIDDFTPPGDLASDISFFRNKSCIVPKITPDIPQTICSGFTLKLQGTISAGATYMWLKDGVDTAPPITTSFIEPATSGTYSLRITSDACTRTSAGVAITVVAGAALPAPTFTSNAPVCVDGTLNLTATSAGASGYEWTGPASFTGSGSAVSRPDFQENHAGKYEVKVMSGTCVAAQGSVLVSSVTLRSFQLSVDSDLICSGDTKVLSVSPNDVNFTYQWSDANGEIAGATNPTLNVSTSGTYFYKATSTLFPGCLPAPSEQVTLTVVESPVVAFTSPAQSCKDNVITFTDQSTVAAGADATYSWTFGDGGTSDVQSPSHAYITTGTFNVKLVVAYRGNACAKELTKPINIVAAPVASITTPSNNFSICSGDELELAVSSAFTTYLWSTTATTPTIAVTSPGTYDVSLTNSIGCVINVSKEVTALPTPTVTITATPDQINIGETTQLQATEGMESYEWTPSETLSNATIANPVATPKESTTYTVVVTNASGCEGTADRQVIVTQDNITNILKPSNFFTPNDIDTVNPVWEVGNILNFPQCGVVVFDDKGQKVYEAKPYLNEWDGTRDGKQVPAGVYYYIIRCDGESQAKAGSITLIR